MLDKVIGIVIGLVIPYIIKVIKWFILNHTKWGKQKIKQTNKKSYSDLIEELRRAFK